MDQPFNFVSLITQLTVFTVFIGFGGTWILVHRRRWQFWLRTLLIGVLTVATVAIWTVIDLWRFTPASSASEELHWNIFKGAFVLVSFVGFLVQRRHAQNERLRQQASSEAGITVYGLSEGNMKAICQKTGARICNAVWPSAVVIVGTIDAIEKTIVLARQQGATIIPLEVMGLSRHHSRR